MDPKLGLTYCNDNVDLGPNFCLFLQHSISESTSCQSNGSWLSPPASVQAPKFVPTFHLQKIEIVMNFTQRPKNWLGRLTENSISTFESVAFDGAGNIIKSVLGMNGTPFSLWDTIMCDQSVPNLVQSGSVVSNAPLQDLPYDNDETLDECILLHKSSSSRLSPTRWLALPTPSVLSSLERPSEEEVNDTSLEEAINRSTLDISSIKKMADFAIRHLVGGRQIKNLPGIKVMKPQPSQTLSGLAPGLWSPEFLQVRTADVAAAQSYWLTDKMQAMSQRSRFLTVVSHTISHSFLRNAQSPSLRRKLAILAKTPVGVFHENAHNDGDAGDSSGDYESDTLKTAGHLNQIVQGSLWRMMHLSLYDPLSARRLLPAPEPRACIPDLESEKMIEEDRECAVSLCDYPPHNHDLFSTAAIETDEFDDLFDEPPGEVEEEGYEDFEALLDDNPVEGVRVEFEDLFSARTPRDNIISSEDILENALGNDEMDVDMIFQDGSNSCGLDGEGRPGEILLDPDYDGVMEMQIDNESMLI